MESRAPGLARESPHGSHGCNATQSHLAGLCGLDSQSLSHNRAAASDGLQIGHAATTGRGLAGGRREGAERGRSRLLQEGAHGLGLAKNGVHDCGFGECSGVGGPWR